MAPSKKSYPGRVLLFVLALVVLLYVGVFVGKPHTPALGLDLRGGTSITLQPQTKTGQKIDAGDLEQSKNILTNRVNGTGVSNALVSVEGNNIVVQVPGSTNPEVIKAVEQTAALEFRPVESYGAGSGDNQVSGQNGAAPSIDSEPSITVESPSGAGSTPEGTPTVEGTPTANDPSARGARAAASPSASGAAASGTSAASPSAAGSQAASPSGASSPAASPAASPSGDAKVVAINSEAKSDAAWDTQATNDFKTLVCPASESATDPAHANLGVLGDQDATNRANHKIVACGDPAMQGRGAYLLDKAILTGTDVKTAAGVIDPTTGKWQVTLTLTGSGQKKWAAYTGANNCNGDNACTSPTGNPQFAIVLDGSVKSAPQIISKIDQADSQITGSFTQASAKDLANVIKFGRLPIAFTPQDTQTISPSLGSDQLKWGLTAGVVGIILVIGFTLLYYRGLGLVTIASLCLSGLMLYALVTLLGRTLNYTLTLAGIAGFIVAVGITADSFIVYFERLRDEVREGRTMRQAVDRGWIKARKTVLSADAVTFMAAVILYWVSIGDVKGFAFTLGLSTVCDLFIVFFFTHPVLQLLSRTKLYGNLGAWTGLAHDRADITAVKTAHVHDAASAGKGA